FLTCFRLLSMEGSATPAVCRLQRAAAGKAGLEVVIEGDLALAIAPAQKHVPAVLLEEEVDEAGVDVLDVCADLLDVAQLLGQRVVEALEQPAQAIDERIVGKLVGFGTVRREAERIELFVSGAELRPELRHRAENLGEAGHERIGFFPGEI